MHLLYFLFGKYNKKQYDYLFYFSHLPQEYILILQSLIVKDPILYTLSKKILNILFSTSFLYNNKCKVYNEVKLKKKSVINFRKEIESYRMDSIANFLFEWEM